MRACEPDQEDLVEVDEPQAPLRGARGRARVIAEEIGREVHHRPVEIDGAARAARLLAELL